MQIKVVKAPTMKEALEEVKKALGADAVILHTKKYKEGGVFGILGNEVVEVTAAVEDEPPKRNTIPPASKVLSRPASSVLGAYKTAASVQQTPSIPFVPPAGNAPNSPPPPFDIPTFQNNTQGQRASISSEPKAAPEDAEKIRRLEGELAQMKELLAQVMSKDTPEEKFTIQDALRKQEVGERILKDMAGKAKPGDTLLEAKNPRAKEIVAAYLADAVQFSKGISLNEHGARIAALFGATGVGKTTTIAKIAARFVLEKNVRAALITADTYRISAVEQLKTYSDILGIPLEIVYSPDELQKAIRKHRDKDLILLDTAGRSPYNDGQVQELADLLAAHANMEKHLVMSAAAKPRDAAGMLKKFALCRPDRLIFTKTDETESLGMIPNLLAGSGLALSFLTTGQSVPDDILPATPEALADMLLRD